MNVTFARLAIASLARIPSMYDFKAVHNTPIPTDNSEVFPEHTISVNVDTGTSSREELFRRYMQSSSYARKLIFALQQRQANSLVKTLIDRIINDKVVVSVELLYKAPPVAPKKKKTPVQCTVYRNGIFDPKEFHCDAHEKIDSVMFDAFVKSYLNGDYDGLFRS